MLLKIQVISKLAMLRSYFSCTTITQLLVYCSIAIFADDGGHQQNSNAMTISTHNKTILFIAWHCYFAGDSSERVVSKNSNAYM